MADRSVSVVLSAVVAPYVAGMARASAATAGFAKTAQAQLGTATTQAGKFGATAGILPGKLAAVGTAVGLIGLAGVAAVKVFADFDEAMSAVGAATQATGGELAQLREAAVQMGAGTKFSATEAARGIEALGKAGVGTADIVGGALAGALDLAAAGGVDVATAAETAAGAVTQFNLTGRDVPHVADLLAAAAGKAQGEVTDMAAALQQSGGVAAQMGLSIEETSATLAAFASNALIGSDAGTSLRTMLIRLANPSAEAASEMQRLGIAAYDSQGAFVGVESLAGQLRTALGGLSEEQRNAALAIIFGNDAIRAANVLYEQGSAGIAQWTREVDDTGFAADQAATRTDNLKGDIEKLGGALEKLAIGQAGGANDALRDLTQELTEAIGAVDEYSSAWADLNENVTSWLNRNVAPGVTAGLDAITFGAWSGVVALDNNTAAAEANKDAIARMDEVAAGHAENLAGYAAAQEGATGAIREQVEGLGELRAAAFETSNAFLGLSNANIAYEQAVDDASAAAKEHGETLDLDTDAGRRNQEALNNIGAAALAVLEPLYAVVGGEQAAAAAAADMRGQLVAAGVRFGMTEAQANAYADEVLNIPAKASTSVSQPGMADARANARGLASEIAGIPRNVFINIRETITRGVRYTAGTVGGVNVGQFAGGGLVADPLAACRRDPAP